MGASHWKACCVQRDKGFAEGDDASQGGSFPLLAVKVLGNSQRELQQEAELVPTQACRPHCAFGVRCSRGDPYHFLDFAHPGDYDCEAAAEVPEVSDDWMECLLEARDGSYGWIRFANQAEDRQLRAAAAAFTLRVGLAGKYQLSGSTVDLSSVAKLIEGTRILTLRDVEAELGQVIGDRVPLLGQSVEPTAVEAALARARNGEKVAVLGAASAYHPAGGFRTGGRHALEEAMCTQSTLALSIQRAVHLSRTPGKEVHAPARVSGTGKDWFCYIPEEGVVLSPDVEVFRASSNTGYRFLPKPVQLTAVVSVAMPNNNPTMRDCPVDVPADPKMYHNLLCTKLKAALGAAVLAGARVIVVPGVGCGVYQNQPAAVGRALGEALLWPLLAGRIDEVLLAGVPPDLESAARDALKQPCHPS